MIPEAAVEAAAKGMFAEEQCDRRQKLDVESNWRGRLDDRDRDEYRKLSRAALEAAAPHMLEACWDVAAEAAIEREHTYGAAEKARYDNPYRRAP